MRRTLATLAIAILFAAVPALAQRLPQNDVISPREAHEKAAKGEIVLVDVRTPEEWRETGLPASGHAITMHQEPQAFVAALEKALGGDRSKPLAVICRTGSRTSGIYAPLQQAGFTRLYDVAEGMVGGRNGPGWIKTGLPLRPAQSGPAPKRE